MSPVNTNVMVVSSTKLSGYVTQMRIQETDQPEFASAMYEAGLILTEAALESYFAENDPIPAADLYFVALLRAGLGLWKAAVDFSNNEVPSGFIDMERNEDTLLATCNLYKCHRNLSDRIVLVFDPMLATGGSMSRAITKLKTESTAITIIAVTLLSVPEGLARMMNDHPDVMIVTAAIDAGLNEHGFIVPGLGDAGDRLFGPK